MQAPVLRGRPFGEQDCSGIFPAEQHRRPGVLLLPTLEIAMLIKPRAGQVLANLGVAVGHSGHLRVVQICAGKFFPTVDGSRAVKSEQGSAVEDDVADLDHALQTNNLAFVDLILTGQLGVVAKVAQEPVQLPQAFGQ